MPALDSLKVETVPAAFAPTAQAHNALVDLIASMVGQNGAKVTVSEGRILIEYDKTTAPGNGGSGGGSTDAEELHYNAGTLTIDIDASGVVLTKSGITLKMDPVTGALTAESSTYLAGFGATGISATKKSDGTGVYIDSGGSGGDQQIQLINAGGNYILIKCNEATDDKPTIAIYDSNYVSTISAQTITVSKNSTGKTCTIDGSLLTHDVSLREIDVCDSGVAKKMLVLGSAAY